MLVVPAAGGPPSHHAANASAGSGHADRNVDSRSRRTWSTSDDQSGDDHVGHAPERADPHPCRQLIGEVRPFGVVAAQECLHVGEPGPVLDVQQRPTFAVDGHEVRATRELEVLVRLIEADLEPEGPEAGRLELPECRVDRVRIARGGPPVAR